MTEPLTSADEDLRSFLLVLRRALMVIVRYIEKRYELGEYKSPSE